MSRVCGFNNKSSTKNSPHLSKAPRQQSMVDQIDGLNEPVVCKVDLDDNSCICQPQRDRCNGRVNDSNNNNGNSMSCHQIERVTVAERVQDTGRAREVIAERFDGGRKLDACCAIDPNKARNDLKSSFRQKECSILKLQPTMDCSTTSSLKGGTSQEVSSTKELLKRIKCDEDTELFESHKIEESGCSCKVKPNSQKGLTNNQLREQERAEVKHRTQCIIDHTDPLKSKGGGRVLIQTHKLVSLGERQEQNICNKHMPWFGIDVGGSLVKVVFFDPKDVTRNESVTLKRIRRHLKSAKAYGTTGKRDTHLEMPNCLINNRVGSLHFIRFATSQMPEFLAMAKNKRFADTVNTVCATGGGACKFEEDIKTNLGITIYKTDELDSIIHGIHYIDKYNSERECYFLEDPLDDAKCVKVPYDFSKPYPYLVVNIGSGVSILAVYSSTSYSRISGSSIGGGTFLGLCCLLTQCKTFDEAIKLAKAGSSTKIDKLVKDIYGGDYPKFNLSGNTVASSFGHMNIAEKRKDVKREDLARALLEMVTINIGSIARMCAANEGIDRVVFVGNFLRVNQLSMRLLSYSVNYWSRGAMKALFLEHEGYFGAVGCFVESIQGSLQ